jgi:hypothetical protein
MKSCDRGIAIQAALEVARDPSSLREPLSLMPVAQVLFANGEKEEALFWFYAAQLRARYELVFENGDRGQLLQTMLMSVGQGINNYGFSDVTRMQRTIERVLAWDKATANPFRERPQTPEQRAQVTAIYSGLRDLQNQLKTNGPSLQQQARENEPMIRELLREQEEERCRTGAIDPSLVEQRQREEEAGILQFVRTHPQILRDVGPVDTARIDMASTKRGEQLPSHYSVQIRGQRAQTFAEIDVARSSTGTDFKLRCTNATGPRHSRDPCAP